MAVLNTGQRLMHFLWKLTFGYPQSDLSKSLVSLPSILRSFIAVKSRSGQPLGSLEVSLTVLSTQLLH